MSGDELILGPDVEHGYLALLHARDKFLPRHRIEAVPIVEIAVRDALHVGDAMFGDAEKASLYNRLGGIYAIATVVDEFIELLLVNDILNTNSVTSDARTTVPKAGLKYQVTSMVAWVTRGTGRYSGRSMPESHAHLGITEAKWGRWLTCSSRY